MDMARTERLMEDVNARTGITPASSWRDDRDAVKYIWRLRRMEADYWIDGCRATKARVIPTKRFLMPESTRESFGRVLLTLKALGQ
ncbi:hypothetical protein DW355_07020 [Hylemonella gracilis]|uniref:Uncharacterized protein n=1 Tax=Hylemonella gracilis TaxID=80880 RepID=A0A4P6UKC6_9BURK|nr:hypothetical protein DW355_07020 [Hylemonella gracilis]